MCFGIFFLNLNKKFTFSNSLIYKILIKQKSLKTRIKSELHQLKKTRKKKKEASPTVITSIGAIANEQVTVKSILTGTRNCK